MTTPYFVCSGKISIIIDLAVTFGARAGGLDVVGGQKASDIFLQEKATICYATLTIVSPESFRKLPRLVLKIFGSFYKI